MSNIRIKLKLLLPLFLLVRLVRKPQVGWMRCNFLYCRSFSFPSNFSTWNSYIIFYVGIEGILKEQIDIVGSFTCHSCVSSAPFPSVPTHWLSTWWDLPSWLISLGGRYLVIYKQFSNKYSCVLFYFLHTGSNDFGWQ